MKLDGIEKRTSWPKIGEITVTDAGMLFLGAGVSACDECAEAARSEAARASVIGLMFMKTPLV